MQCKACNYPDSHVIETKRDNHTNHVIRRRECIKCGVRFTTHEQAYNKSEYKTPPPRKVLEK